MSAYMAVLRVILLFLPESRTECLILKNMTYYDIAIRACDNQNAFEINEQINIAYSVRLKLISYSQPSYEKQATISMMT